MILTPPCPRCGSKDIATMPGACLCRIPGHTCWHYPKCNRCGYTNGQGAANSEGNVWFLDGMKTFYGKDAIPLTITEAVQCRIDEYEAALAERRGGKV
jgi:hypothetical protein